MIEIMTSLNTSRHSGIDIDRLRRSTISAITLDLTLDDLDEFDLDYLEEFELSLADCEAGENDENDREQPIINLPIDENNNSSCRWSTTEKAMLQDSPVCAQRKPSITLRWNDSSKFSDASPIAASRRLSMEHVVRRGKAANADESPRAAIRRISVEHTRRSIQAANNGDESPRAAIRRLSVEHTRRSAQSLASSCRKNQAKQSSFCDLEEAAAIATAEVTGSDRWS
mmetsp:Transcript_21431/g.44067  ORF Transcript_21431/g.44067 Transcript_21431/m.44067 type:complete len:227 (-) Transcript_21431:139-819(-)